MVRIKRKCAIHIQRKVVMRAPVRPPLFLYGKATVVVSVLQCVQPALHVQQLAESLHYCAGNVLQSAIVQAQKCVMHIFLC